jgi:putative DNA primase/helicase
MRDPEREGRGLLTIVGNNLGSRHQGYAFQIVPETIGRNNIATSRAVWEREPVGMTADQVLAAWRRASSQHATVEATDWLREQLRGGPKWATEIQEAARKAGHAWRTVRRAADTMGIERRRQGGRNGQWIWSLEATEREEETSEREEETQPGLV